MTVIYLSVYLSLRVTENVIFTFYDPVFTQMYALLLWVLFFLRPLAQLTVTIIRSGAVSHAVNQVNILSPLIAVCLCWWQMSAARPPADSGPWSCDAYLQPASTITTASLALGGLRHPLALWNLRNTLMHYTRPYIPTDKCTRLYTPSSTNTLETERKKEKKNPKNLPRLIIHRNSQSFLYRIKNKFIGKSGWDLILCRYTTINPNL